MIGSPGKGRNGEPQRRERTVLGRDGARRRQRRVQRRNVPAALPPGTPQRGVPTYSLFWVGTARCAVSAASSGAMFRRLYRRGHRSAVSLPFWLEPFLKAFGYE